MTVCAIVVVKKFRLSLLWMKISQPVECADPRHKAVLASSGDHEAWQVVQPPADGMLWDGEGAAAVIGPSDHISLLIQTDEAAIVVPLRFHELKLPREIAADEDEDTSSVEAVVFQHALGQHRAVRRTAAQDAMQVDHGPLIF